MFELNSQFSIADVLVEPDANRLSRSQQQVFIEGRLMALLVFLCRHAGQAVSQQQLMESVWQGNVVSPSAIYRAIAELRKALEKHFGLQSVIQTIPKKGYLIDPDLLSEEPHAGYLAKNRYAWLKPSGLFLAFLIVIFLLIEHSELSQKKNATSALRVKTLTSLSGTEFSPALSPDGDWLLFSHRPQMGMSSRLYLLRLDKASDKYANTKSTENKQPLDAILLNKHNQQASFSRVAWSSSGKQIAYQRLTANSCAIVVADINLERQQLENQQEVSHCTGKVISAISWSNDDQNIFYISALSGRMEAVNHHLKSQQVQSMMSPENPFAWNNFVVSSPFESKVLILSFIDYRQTQFILYDYINRTHQIIHDEPHVIRSASWGNFSQQIIYEVNAQRLKMFDLESNQTQVWYEPGIYLKGVTRSKNKPLYAVGQMQQAEEAIKIAQLEDQKDVSQLWQVNSPLIDKHPEFANSSNQLAFISNRSGNDQIWIRNEIGVLNRVTNFDDEKWFGRLRWSKDDSKILFARGEVIYWVEVDSGKLKTLLKYDSAENKVPYAPNWSSDNSSVFFSLHQGGKNSVWQLKLNSQSNRLEQISSGNSRNLQQSINGNYLYFTTIGMPGLTRFDMTSGVYSKLLPELHPNSWNSWKVTPGGIYYLDINQVPAAVYFYDTHSKTQHQLFEWDVVSGAQFSISHDRSLYARDLFVDSEASIVRISAE